jgi:hypothetical protein
MMSCDETRRSDRPQRLLVILHVANIAGFPLIANIGPLLGIVQEPISIAYRAIVLGLSIASILFYGVHRRGFIRNGHIAALAFFWAIYSVRILSDTILAPVPLGIGRDRFLINIYLICAVPAIALCAQHTYATFRAILTWALLTGVAGAVGALYLGSWRSPDTVEDRLGTAILNPISLGHLGISITILSVYYILTRPHVAKRFLATAACLFGLVVASMATSNGPLVSFAVVLVVVVIARVGRRASMKYVVTTAVLVCILVSACLYVENHTRFKPISRLEVLISYDKMRDTHTTVGIRFQMYKGAIAQFLSSPLLGDCLVERTSLSYPHNVVLEAFMALGVFGGILLCLLLAQGTKQALRIVRGRRPYAYVGALFIQTVIGNMFSGGLTDPGFWGSIGTLAAAVALFDKEALLAKHVSQHTVALRAHESTRRTLLRPASLSGFRSLI